MKLLHDPRQQAARHAALAVFAYSGLAVAIAATGFLAPVGGQAAAQSGAPDLSVTPYFEYAAAHAGAGARLAVRVRLEEGFHVNSDAPLDEFLIPTRLEIDPDAGIEVERIGYPEPFILEQADVLELAVFESEFVIGAQLALPADLVAGSHTVGARLHYQACDEIMCYAPAVEEFTFEVHIVPADEPAVTAHRALFAGLDLSKAGAPSAAPVPSPPAIAAVESDLNPSEVLAEMDGFEVAATAGGYLQPDDFMAFIEAAETGVPQAGWFENQGPLAILALILIGGVALNLTPCVLPLVPVNLGIIGAGARAGSRGRGFALGGVYGFAMALVYGLLGLIVILTSGTFGTLNASPWFNLAIALLFIVLGLAMFDLVIIDFSRWQSKIDLRGDGRGPFALAFGMGAVTALLAGACVAPVVIQVVVFSSNLYNTGTPIALALPFILGLGMAAPWPIAGAGFAALPKPGPWMEKVKYAFGVFILATAAYYGYLAYGLFAQRWVDGDEVIQSVESLIEEGWHRSIGDALIVARTEGKPVLIDVWATWCKNCLTMDKTTLADPAVRAALEDYVKVKYQAEDLNAYPAREIMKRIDAIGLPAYAILHPIEAGAPATPPE